MSNRLVPPREGWRRLGVSRSTALRREKDDPAWPKRRPISDKGALTAYLEDELTAYIASRAAERQQGSDKSRNAGNGAPQK